MKTQWIKQASLFTALGLVILIAKPVWADTEINVKVNVGAPPPIVLEAPPTMLFLPGPGVYVAVEIGYDLFFRNGHYYYFHNSHWFSATGYGGPWGKIKHLPPGLTKFKLKELHSLRDKEFKAFKTKGTAYKGKQLKAISKAAKKSKKPGTKPGMGPRTKKGGKGKKK